MEIVPYKDPVAFRAASFPLLLRNEAENCLALAVLGERADAVANAGTPSRAADGMRMWAFVGAQGWEGVAWWEAPQPLGLTAVPTNAVGWLADALVTARAFPHDVVAPVTTADAFRDVWQASVGCRVSHTITQGIHALDALVPPRAWPPGEMRTATAAEAALLEDWSYRFTVDCGLVATAEGAAASVRHALAEGSRVLWWAGGEPVAMAGFGGWTPNGVRVSWVYTPDAQRGRGYAKALVAALSAELLARGKRHCFLYADMANPVAMALYAGLGYRMVSVAAWHRFAYGNFGAP